MEEDREDPDATEEDREDLDAMEEDLKVFVLEVLEGQVSSHYYSLCKNEGCHIVLS